METLSGFKWFTGKNHAATGKPYEDRTAMLTNRAPLVARAGRGTSSRSWTASVTLPAA